MDDISVFSLIIQSGFIVQLIILLLVIMSIYSWTIIMTKKKLLIGVNKEIKSFNDNHLVGINLEKLYEKTPKIDIDRNSMERIFIAGHDELNNNTDDSLENSYRSMNMVVNNEVDELNKNLSILAMIASSSPYIGLFGTVWGIMHSFIGLASVKHATISIVAPGIAEALIATAFGLFAAIPATIAYNRFSSQVELIHNKYINFIEELFIIFKKK
jgi:biopolymer transport protein TolQ